MVESTSTDLKPFRIGLICICLLFTLGALLRSIKDARTYPGDDLRCKIVGARLLISGRNPYSAEYQNQGEKFVMPIWRINGPSQVTYDPALLLLYSPFSSARYIHVRYAWFGIEWTCLLASALLIAATIPKGNARTAFWCVALVFFFGSTFWRLHAERGQYYVYLLLLFSVSWYLVRRFPGNMIAFAIPLALATSFRPTFAVVGCTLLLFRQWRSAITYFAFVAIFVGCTLPFGGITRWQQFFANVADITRGMSDEAFVDAKWGKEQSPYNSAEGTSFLIEADIPTTSSSLNAHAYKILTRLHLLKPTLQVQRSDRPGKIAIACIMALAAIPFGIYGRRRAPVSTIFFASVTLALICDMFVPVRFSYSDILFLMPVGIFFCSTNRGIGTIAGITLVGLGLLLGTGGDAYLSARWYMMLRPLLILLGCLVKLLSDLRSTSVYDLQVQETLTG